MAYSLQERHLILYMPETIIPMTELGSKKSAGHQNLLWNKSSLESCLAQHSEEEDKRLADVNSSPHHVIASQSSRTSTGDAMQREYDRLTGNSIDNLNDSASGMKSQSTPEACDFTGSSDQYALLFLVRDRWLAESGAEHSNESVNVSKESEKEKEEEREEEEEEEEEEET